MRIVFDTNVLLAGIFTRGICESLLDVCLGSPVHEIVASNYILDEFVDRAIVKFRAHSSQVKEETQILRSQMVIVNPIQASKESCRDPDDLPILGTLLAAQADYLVTGDRDLLDIKSFNGIPIIKPRALHELLQKK